MLRPRLVQVCEAFDTSHVSRYTSHLTPHTSPVCFAGWTSYRCLHDKLKITSADTLLITGGSGGTGSFAVRHTKHFNRFSLVIFISGTTCQGCGSSHNHRYLQVNGSSSSFHSPKPLIMPLIITTCSEKNVEFVQSLGKDLIFHTAFSYQSSRYSGATHVLDYTKELELDKKGGVECDLRADLQ
jgi:NADPH:quinone reductase-like Zn-dependent oxidoreductase